MEVVFKIMEENELAQTLSLCNECFDEKTPIDYAQKIYTENANDSNQIYIIGKYEDEIIAHAKINIIPTIYQDMGTYAILNHVCVKPKYRREHIGTKLLDVCFKIAKSKDCKCVELWSKNFRTAAHNLYHKYGFKVMDAKFFSKDIEEELR